MTSRCPKSQQAPKEADSGSIGVSIKIALIKMIQFQYNIYTSTIHCAFFYAFFPPLNLGYNPKEFDLVTITTQQ